MHFRSMLGTFTVDSLTNESITFVLISRPENTEYNSLILTYKNIDKKTFFSIPIHFKNIDDIIKELEKPHELVWPNRLEKEVRIRNSTFRFKLKMMINLHFSCTLIEKRRPLTFQPDQFANFHPAVVLPVQWN